MTGLIDTPKRHDLIFDVGMHRGEDTEFYLRKGFRVLAFEANPALVESATRRFRYFIDGGQLKIVAGAIVDPELLRTGQRTVNFYRNDRLSVFGTVDPTWASRNE